MSSFNFNGEEPLRSVIHVQELHEVKRRPCSIQDAFDFVVPSSPIQSVTGTLASVPTSEEVPIFLFNSISNDDISFRRVSAVSSLDCFNLNSSRSSDTIQTVRTCSTYGTFGQSRNSKRYSKLYSSLQTPSTRNVIYQEATINLNLVNALAPQDHSEDPSSQSIDLGVTTSLTTPIVTFFPSSPSVCSTSSIPMFSSSHSHETAITQYTGHVLPPSLESAVSISRGDSAISLPSLNVSRSCHDKKASSASVDVCPAPPLKSAPAPDSMSSHVGLPQNMIWLKDTVVEILIDQEGFRSITPTFRFAGYSTNTRSLDTTEKLVGGAAQFVPIVRQTFNFHYAPFDGQPVLRRISVNGTSRDHVSRQATMCLKSNGVYTVRGSETLLVPSNELQVDENYSIQPSPDAPKLHWKFDYFVDDRRSSGKIEGEKTFTPLTFSCSPLLLHPLQGKKIRLMHVMKKNVVTKLVAEKMELPKTTSCRSPPPSLPVPNSPPLARINPSKAHIWSLHRRLQSHGHSIGHGRSESSDIRGSSLCATNQMRSSNQPTEMRKHRRASSAGDIGATFTGHAIQNVPDRTDEGVAHKVNPLYNRHILPPSKLSELLDNNENAKPKVESLIGLSPAPRNHYNARPGRLL